MTSEEGSGHSRTRSRSSTSRSPPLPVSISILILAFSYLLDSRPLYPRPATLIAAVWPISSTRPGHYIVRGASSVCRPWRPVGELSITWIHLDSPTIAHH